MQTPRSRRGVQLRVPAAGRKSGGLAAANLGDATAGAAGATNRVAIGAEREIYRPEVTAALCAVRLAASDPCDAIGIDRLGALALLLIRTWREILADDGTHERAGQHVADLEQAHLLLGQAHLRYRIIDHDAQFGMEINRECIAAHVCKDFVAGPGSVTEVQLCGKETAISIGAGRSDAVNCLIREPIHAGKHCTIAASA